MTKHLFFITSVDDAKSAIPRTKRLNKEKVYFTVVSSDPLANIYLEKQMVKFEDIGNYYPPPQHVTTARKQLKLLIQKWSSDQQICSRLSYKNQFQLNRLIGYSLDAYLAEILHSLMTAEEILKKTKPTIVHVSPRWLESPFRRYQSEKLNLENVALFHLAKQRQLHVSTFAVSLLQTTPAYVINFLLTLIWQSLRTSYHQLFHPAQPVKSNKLTIMANYYQLENFIPVIKELKKQNLQFTVIGKISPEQTKRLSDPIPEFISLETLETQKKPILEIRLIKIISYTLKLINLLPYLRRFFSLKNQEYWQFLFPKLLYFYMIEFPLLTDYLDGAGRLFKPGKLLVTPATADNISQTIATAAKSEKVTVLELQHGNLLNEDDDRHFRANDYYAVWGPEVRSIIAQSQSPKQIPITGYSQFDRYWYPQPLIISKSSVRQKLNISNNTKVLLVLSVFPSGETRLYQDESPFQFMAMVFKTISMAKENCKVIFRPHPSLDAPWIIPLAKHLKIDLFYDHRELKLEEVIAASDIVISNFSTTTIDAMFQQKPILFYDFPADGVYKYSAWFMISSGAVKLFKTQDQLKELIQRSLYNQQFRQEIFDGQKLFLKKYCSAFSAPAAGKVQSLITKLCS